jgi:DNA-binding MarR family transcriptional regulator
MPDKQQTQNELRQLAWYDFLRAYATVLRKIDAELQADKVLSMEWYDVLLTLARAPGQRLRLSEIAERVLLSRSGITRLIDRIESAGLLKREPSPEDRRGMFAVLLPAGRTAINQSWPTYSRLILTHFGQHLTDAEAQAIHSAFTKNAPPPILESEPVTIGVKKRNPPST